VAPAAGVPGGGADDALQQPPPRQPLGAPGPSCGPDVRPVGDLPATLAHGFNGCAATHLFGLHPPPPGNGVSRRALAPAVKASCSRNALIRPRSRRPHHHGIFLNEISLGYLLRHMFRSSDVRSLFPRAINHSFLAFYAQFCVCVFRKNNILPKRMFLRLKEAEGIRGVNLNREKKDKLRFVFLKIVL